MLLNYITLPIHNCCWKIKALAAFSKSLACHYQTCGGPQLARGPCVVHPWPKTTLPWVKSWPVARHLLKQCGAERRLWCCAFDWCPYCGGLKRGHRRNKITRCV